jgi:hypothetical protein
VVADSLKKKDPTVKIPKKQPQVYTIGDQKLKINREGKLMPKLQLTFEKTLPRNRYSR